MAGMKFAVWTGLILAMCAAIYLWATRVQKSLSVQKQMAAIREKAALNAQEEIDRLRTLEKVAKDETKSLDERKKAIDELNKVIPEYNGALDETSGKYTENKKALDEYIKSLIRSYEIEGAKESIKENAKKKAELKRDRLITQKELDIANRTQANSNMSGPRFATTSGPFVPSDVAGNAGQSAYIAGLEAKIRKYDKEIRQIETLEEEILNAYGADAFVEESPHTKTKVESDPALDDIEIPNSEEEIKKRMQKAKQALRDALEEQKALFLQAQADATLRYVNGIDDYLAYTAEIERLEADNADKVVKIHEDHNRIDIDAYGAALKKKADLLLRHQEEEAKRSLKGIEDEHAGESRKATEFLRYMQ